MTTCEASRATALGQMELFQMSSVEASPARTSAWQAKGQGSQASAAAYGRSTPELLARLDLNGSSWKTSQLCLVEGSTTFLETWPRSGTMRNGIAYQLAPLALPTEGTESGLWPTPVVPNGGRSIAHVDQFNGRTAYHKGKKVQVDLNQMVRLWPTPTAADGRRGTGTYRPQDTGIPLPQVVAMMMATPTARDWRSGKASAATHARNSRPLSEQIGGSLNPTWVEWLMGFPLGWTDLEDSATPSSRKSRKLSDAR
jgi:hypothetical protein